MMEDKARQKAFHKQLIEFNPATLPPPDPPTLLPRIPTLPQSSLPSCRPSVVRSAVVVLTHAPLAPGPLPSPRVLCVSSLLRGMSDGGWGGAGRGWAGRRTWAGPGRGGAVLRGEAAWKGIGKGGRASCGVRLPGPAGPGPATALSAAARAMGRGRDT